MANAAIIAYNIRNKMAISIKSPPELNSVVGFQSHKILKNLIVPLLVPGCDMNLQSKEV